LLVNEHSEIDVARARLEKTIGGKTVRNTTGLRRGGPGRPKGVPNKATVEVKAWAQSVVEDPQVQATTLDLARRGKLDSSLFRELLHYAYGKPKESMSVDLGVLYLADTGGAEW
jgi:hypothetical protein